MRKADEIETRPMWVLDIKRPQRGVRLVDCEIHIGPKAIYGVAIYRDRIRARYMRHFYGASMFGTREAAERAAYAYMAEIVNSFWHQRFAWGDVDECRRALAARRSA